ncbi:hypothetical protein FLONG3_2845 [Fusarium longipes]|uniref:Uncharacterized protein n=1 Tax=Fusarium longipes TaxID=694270 RepID=A0A395T2N4_9HYPO|nr:hypothetical protein FLONG3_2845 [Fusarium longipes]
MWIPSFISYCVHYGWALVKAFPGDLKFIFLSTLPITAFTILLGFINGLILGPWYHGITIEHLDLLVNNMIKVKAYEWFSGPDGVNPFYTPQAPYHVQQLHDPLEWTRTVGMKRPSDWSTNNVGKLASFRDLYRVRRRYSDDPSWHRWIYLSTSADPMSDISDYNPWDKAFSDLLEYRDKHEPLGRSNFNYIACPKNFLCSLWSISGPALIHLTNEPITRNATQERSRKPILDPVSVRVFELPLTEPVIPGSFPTYFEQMRSITASNSTYWTTQMKYSNFDQVRGRSLKVLKGVSEKHPKTYGMLSKIEDKWTRFLAAEETGFIFVPRLVSFAAGAIPSYFGSKYWWQLQQWRKGRQVDKLQEGNDSQSARDAAVKDPVAHQLQLFLDSLSDDDKQKFGKTYRGGALLDKIENGLAKNEWNTQEDVIKKVEDALRR